MYVIQILFLFIGLFECHSLFVNNSEPVALVLPEVGLWLMANTDRGVWDDGHHPIVATADATKAETFFFFQGRTFEIELRDKQKQIEFLFAAKST